MLSFADLDLHEFPCWTLRLHHDQYYLGRAVLWLERPGDMQRLSGLQFLEMAGLLAALTYYEDVLSRLWSPNHMNYAWLGNDFEHHSGHGHMHVIPRYNRPVEFAGQTFVDERWGENYAPYPKRRYPEELLLQIRDTLKGRIRG